MCVFGSPVIIGMCFSGFNNDLIIVIPFPNSDDVVGFILG